MAVPINRRSFLKGASSTAAALLGAPLSFSSRAGAAGDRLVAAVGQGDRDAVRVAFQPVGKDPVGLHA